MLKLPLRDENGKVIEHDHDDITNDQTVIRGITQHHIKDGRITSIAYQASSDIGEGMSVELKELIELDNKSPVEHIMSNSSFIGAVSFTVGSLREINYKVGYDPISALETNPNPYHCQVWGEFPKSKKKKLARIAKKFADLDDIDLC
jgi:hypothetical protein